MNDYDAQQYIIQQLTLVGQNYRRIKFNIHIWGFQFDGGIVSNSGNPQLVWNLLGKSEHRSSLKHRRELIKRGIVEFELPIRTQNMLEHSVREMTEYVKQRRASNVSLKKITDTIGVALDQELHTVGTVCNEMGKL